MCAALQTTMTMNSLFHLGMFVYKHEVLDSGVVRFSLFVILCLLIVYVAFIARHVPISCRLTTSIRKVYYVLACFHLLIMWRIGGYGSVIHEQIEMADHCFGQYAHNNQPVHYMLYMHMFDGYAGACSTQGRGMSCVDHITCFSMPSSCMNCSYLARCVYLVLVWWPLCWWLSSPVVFILPPNISMRGPLTVTCTFLFSA